MPNDSRLIDLLVEWEERQREGHEVAAEELATGAPELLAELKQRIEDLRQVDRVLEATPPARGTTASPAVIPSIPGYEILGELGRGGMGVVYKARQVGLNRLVALKMIRAGAHADREEVARFRAEAEAVAQLRHPHIVQIYEVGEQDGLPYFSLEYVDGGSLAQELAGTPLPSEEAACLVETLARAVHYAHQRGIVHRDLKPANILLSVVSGQSSVVGEGRGSPLQLTTDNWQLTTLPKITDFGLAKRLDVEVERTRTGAIMGTPSYMAPEQALGRIHDLGPRTDVHALGVLLYELLTGRPPFRAASVLDTLEQVRSQEPVSPRSLQPKLSRDLETICLKCLHKEPRQRYADAAALAEDLRRFLNNEPIQARPVGRWERGWRWCRRNPAVAGLLAAVGLTLLAGTGVASYFALREHRQALNARHHAGVAEQQKNRANAEAEAAEKSARRERRQRAKAERQLYLTRIHLAHSAWRDNEITRALALLDACPWDLRGWEWGYLRRLCHGSRFTLRGHVSRVTSVAFSPAGRLLASAGEDGTVQVWNPDTGQEVLALQEHAGPVGCLAFAPDGKRLAAGTFTRTSRLPFRRLAEVKIWDLSTGQAVLTLPAHAEAVTSLAFSPDGKWLASGGRDKSIKIWDLTNGQEALVLKGFKDHVSSVAFSPDSKILATVAGAFAVETWNALTGEKIHTLRGHTNRVACVVFSPDGKRLASAGMTFDMQKQSQGSGEVKVWDSATGKELLSFTRHTNLVNSVVFSADSKRLASAGEDREVKVWDPTTGQEIASLRGHTDAVTCLSIAPDGKQLASASNDQTVKIWDLDSSPEAVTLAGHNRPVRGLACSPDGKRLASAGGDGLGGEIKIWDAVSGRQALLLKGHKSFVYCVAFSPDSKLLASGGYDKTIRIWDLEAGREIHTFGGLGSEVHSVAFSPDGGRLASAGSDHAIKIWDWRAGQELLSLRGHTGIIHGVAYSSDGKLLASASQDATIRLWDPTTGQESLLIRGHTQGVTSVAFSPDGQRLASTSHDRTIRVWEVGTGQSVVQFESRIRTVNEVAFHRDGSRLAGAAWDGTVRVWDLTLGQEALTLRGHAGMVTRVVFSPDGRQLVSACSNGLIKIWDAHSGPEPFTLRGHSGLATSAVYSADGKRLASASGSGTQTEVKIWDAVIGQEVDSRKWFHRIFGMSSRAFSRDLTRFATGSGDGVTSVWDLETGREAFSFSGPGGSVTSVAFSPDAMRLAAAGGKEGTIQVWNLDTQQVIHTLQGHSHSVTRMAFSPDGKQLATASRDHSVKVWDLSTGQVVLTLQGHKSEVHSAAFSADGRRLASGSGDETVKVWDATTGQEISTLQGHQGYISGVAFHPDGRRLASAGSDQTIRLWDLTTGQAVFTLRGHTHIITSVAFSPDGQRLVSTGGDEVKVWDLALWERSR